jgi:hypothetical protein
MSCINIDIREGLGLDLLVSLSGIRPLARHRFARFGCIDALRGSSNFEITEYILIKLILELEQPFVAMLCKTSVARDVFHFISDVGLPIPSASLREIEAKKWFEANVDPCLFTVRVGKENGRYQAQAGQDLKTNEQSMIISIQNSKFVSVKEAYKHSAFADSVCPYTRRQGIKHDASSIMGSALDSSRVIRGYT